MDPYILGIFANGCTVMLKEEALKNATKADRRILTEGNVVRALDELCNEIRTLLSRPVRLFRLFTASDWIRFLRGLIDANGELIDEKAEEDLPTLVLFIRLENRKLAYTINAALKFFGVLSDVLTNGDKAIIVVHERDSLARLFKTIRPNIAITPRFRVKWIRHYEPYGEPIVVVKEDQLV